MFRGAVARAGVFAFMFACLVPILGPTLPTDMRSISVAEVSARPAGDPSPAPERVRDVARAEVVLGVATTPVPTLEPVPVATTEPTPEPTPVPTPAPAVATLPALPDPPTAGIVIASWYGPGFYGNRTACGQIYTPEIIGVAHRTLRCGTLLVLEYRGRSVTVPVIDRGPYIAGRTLDLSNATRLAMACPDLCTLSMRIGP
jgi:rare lipoprotein A (RlpA)-like double-psi beta-barrel protein